MPAIEQEAVDYLNQALDRFDEALAIPLTNPLAIDGTIQRFEFSFELAWKAIKSVGKYVGTDRKSPRDAIKAAYGFGWIDDETLWIDILHDQNLSSHTYREDIALAVYHRLKIYAVAMRKLAICLNHVLKKDSTS
jgi:nucleotidyltransferase substrate binding protein (TIGR01987 family)